MFLFRCFICSLARVLTRIACTSINDLMTIQGDEEEDVEDEDGGEGGEDGEDGEDEGDEGDDEE